MFLGHSEHVVDALDSIEGFGTFAMSRQPFRRSDFILYGAAVRRHQVWKFQCRLFDRTELHGDVKPMQNPDQRSLGSVDSFLKFASAIFDDRYFLIRRSALLR